MTDETLVNKDKFILTLSIHLRKGKCLFNVCCVNDDEITD